MIRRPPRPPPFPYPPLSRPHADNEQRPSAEFQKTKPDEKSHGKDDPHHEPHRRGGHQPRRHRTSRPYPRRSIRTLNIIRSEEHTSELQSPCNLVCRLLLEKK